ncbi:hypothetical protein PHET_07421 [Paragonimus heterotremus]|uniref:PDZ domain-containing protein n=1 Tax=Paragonimus heterotremus TaxID=100268 RepID=A0A8J4SWY9_9TREM|nr:hypothetical protein PHET_07421 [Paragonimus heterotremus]
MVIVHQRRQSFRFGFDSSTVLFYVVTEEARAAVYLTTVIRGSPAAHAGLKVGDELLQLNGFPLGQLSAQTIMEMIRSTPQSLRIVYRPSGLCDSTNDCHTERCRKCLSNLSQPSSIYETLQPEFLAAVTTRTEHAIQNSQHDHSQNLETSDTNEYTSLRLVSSLSERTLRCHDSQHPEDF